MAVRKIIHIDEEKCDGCGLCADACHEGAIQIIDGKAKLVSESYCDGLGDCLAECPQGAITTRMPTSVAWRASVKTSSRVMGSPPVRMSTGLLKAAMPSITRRHSPVVNSPS